jgi:site-specific recombinase XerD
MVGADAAETKYRAAPRDKGLFVVHGEGELVAQANGFLATLTQRGFSPRTVRAYAYDLIVFFRWLAPRALTLTRIEEADLLEYIRHQQASDAKPRSINRRLSTCRLFIRHVSGKEPERHTAGHYRGRGRDRNLGLHVLRPQRRVALRVKVPRALVEPLSREQVREYLCGLRRYRDLSIVHLMLLCGLRSREVLQLRVEDVSFDDLQLRVRGKGDKERALPMPDLLLRLLLRYIEFERPEGLATASLFVVLKGQQRGSAMTAAGLRSLFRHRRKRNGLRNANAHRFRHTFGTDMARAGVRLPILQRMMGHAQAETTLQYINLAMTDIAAEYARAVGVIQRRYSR